MEKGNGIRGVSPEILAAVLHTQAATRSKDAHPATPREQQPQIVISEPVVALFRATPHGGPA